MIKHFTSEDLYKLIYQNDYDVFTSNMEDITSRIKYFTFNNGYWREDFYVVKFVDNVIVGILDYAICNQPTFQGNLHFVSYVSVDPNHQNKGIATELIKYWKDNLLRSDLGVCGCSGFTESGHKYLFNALSKIDNVECEDKISFGF